MAHRVLMHPAVEFTYFSTNIFFWPFPFHLLPFFSEVGENVIPAGLVRVITPSGSPREKISILVLFVPLVTNLGSSCLFVFIFGSCWGSFAFVCSSLWVHSSCPSCILWHPILLCSDTHSACNTWVEQPLLWWCCSSTCLHIYAHITWQYTYQVEQPNLRLFQNSSRPHGTCCLYNVSSVGSVDSTLSGVSKDDCLVFVVGVESVERSSAGTAHVDELSETVLAGWSISRCWMTLVCSFQPGNYCLHNKDGVLTFKTFIDSEASLGMVALWSTLPTHINCKPVKAMKNHSGRKTSFHHSLGGHRGWHTNGICPHFW